VTQQCATNWNGPARAALPSLSLWDVEGPPAWEEEERLSAGLNPGTAADSVAAVDAFERGANVSEFFSFMTSLFIDRLSSGSFGLEEESTDGVDCCGCGTCDTTGAARFVAAAPEAFLALLAGRSFGARRRSSMRADPSAAPSRSCRVRVHHQQQANSMQGTVAHVYACNMRDTCLEIISTKVRSSLVTHTRSWAFTADGVRWM
jgi:hypothetical protein